MYQIYLVSSILVYSKKNSYSASSGLASSGLAPGSFFGKKILSNSYNDEFDPQWHVCIRVREKTKISEIALMLFQLISIVEADLIFTGTHR